MSGIVKVLGVVIVIILAIVLLDFMGIFRSPPLEEPQLDDIISERYPEAEPTKKYLENCTICDDSGCRSYPGPCWKITMVIEGEEGLEVVEVVMDAYGNVLEEKSGSCTEWWCDAEPCQHVFTEQDEESKTIYTNMGCEPPEFTCDSQHDRCRGCLTDSECVAETEETASGITTYQYEILTTGERSFINTNDLICTVKSRGEILFQDITDVESCRSLIVDYVKCHGDSCDYVPDFDLIT